MFSTVGGFMMHVGDILSTVGDVQYRGGYHDTCGGYHEYRGGGGVQYRGDTRITKDFFPTVLMIDIPHVHHDIPLRY